MMRRKGSCTNRIEFRKWGVSYGRSTVKAVYRSPTRGTTRISTRIWAAPRSGWLSPMPRADSVPTWLATNIPNGVLSRLRWNIHVGGVFFLHILRVGPERLPLVFFVGRESNFVSTGELLCFAIRLCFDGTQPHCLGIGIVGIDALFRFSLLLSLARPVRYAATTQCKYPSRKKEKDPSS
jgi:hypothetical protein